MKAKKALSILSKDEFDYKDIDSIREALVELSRMECGGNNPDDMKIEEHEYMGAEALSHMYGYNQAIDDIKRRYTLTEKRPWDDD